MPAGRLLPPTFTTPGSPGNFDSGGKTSPRLRHLWRNASLSEGSRMCPRSMNVIWWEICSTSNVLCEEDSTVRFFVRKHCHQPAQYLSPRDRIETGRRLVQHRQSWSASQRQQQRRFHPLSVRHPLDLLLCLQVEPPRKVVGVCTIPAWIDRPNEVDVPLDRCDPIDRKIRQGILTPRRIRCDLTAGVTLIEKLAL